MSQSADRSTIEAADISSRPITITHAKPHDWHPALRNKSDDVIRAVTQNGGMFGFSIYPHHLQGGSDCTLSDFCEIIARIADTFGIVHFGIGTNLCQDQPAALWNGCALGVGAKRSTMAKALPAPSVFRGCPHLSKTMATLTERS
jgi:microsomal dipeptidase-like Zn-dependent dipeptidase